MTVISNQEFFYYRTCCSSEDWNRRERVREDPMLEPCWTGGTPRRFPQPSEQRIRNDIAEKEPER
jgi:hypothetical protein